MRKYFLILLALTLLSACGQRGPLYLPADAEPASNQADPQNKTDAEQPTSKPTEQEEQ